MNIIFLGKSWKCLNPLLLFFNGKIPRNNFQHPIIMIINNSHLCTTFDHNACYKQSCIYARTHTRAEPVSQHSTGISVLLSRDPRKCCIMLQDSLTSAFLISLFALKNHPCATALNEHRMQPKLQQEPLGFCCFWFGVSFSFLSWEVISKAGNEPGLTHLLLQNCQGDSERLQKRPNVWLSISPRDAACFRIPCEGLCCSSRRSNPWTKWAEVVRKTAMQDIACSHCN